MGHGQHVYQVGMNLDEERSQERTNNNYMLNKLDF